jgi:hypothetical protein
MFPERSFWFGLLVRTPGGFSASSILAASRLGVSFRSEIRNVSESGPVLLQNRTPIERRPILPRSIV